MTRVVHITHEPSERLLRACSIFGVGVTRRTQEERARLRCARACARELDGALGMGSVALVVGASGAGKSTIADALETRTRSVRAGCSGLAWWSGSVVDQFRCGLDRTLSLLARCGLSDATILARTPDELSAGQQARLSLALALERAEPGMTIIADEFCATLDRTTARGVARSVATTIRRDGLVRLVAVTAHDDLFGWMQPNVLVTCPFGGEPEVVRRAEASLGE